MRFARHIDLNLLAVFEAIYLHRSVTGAARRLNLSQPAVSHSLARLREAFGDKLFLRSGNALVPTTLAEDMIGPVREAFQSIERAFSRSQVFDSEHSTRAFAIGLRPSWEMRNFHPIVLAAMKEAPGVRLSSVGFRRSDVVQLAGEGDLDLVLDIEYSASAGLRSERLRSEHLVVVARTHHPRVPGQIDMQTYLALDHVVASPRPRGLGAEDAALALLGERRRIALRCQNVWSAWQIVAQSDLICTLPAAHAETLRKSAENQILPLPLKTEPSTLFMHWHERSDRDPGAAWLRGLVRRELGSAAT